MLELKGVLEEWRAVPESLEGGWGDDDLILGGLFISPNVSMCTDIVRHQARRIDAHNEIRSLI